MSTQPQRNEAPKNEQPGVSGNFQFQRVMNAYGVKLPKISTSWVGRTNVTDDRRIGISI